MYLEDEAIDVRSLFFLGQARRTKAMAPSGQMQVSSPRGSDRTPAQQQPGARRAAAASGARAAAGGQLAGGSLS